MATNTLYLTNLTSNSVSLEGDQGSPKLSIAGTPGAYTTVNPKELQGNDLICDSIAALITSSEVRVNRGSQTGTLVTAAVVTSYQDGTYWDTNQDGTLDNNANTTLNDTHRAVVTGNPHAVLRTDMYQERALVSALAINTLNDEQSVALTGAATDEFSPLYVIVQMHTVVGVAANGDAVITVGITSGGTQILAVTTLTALVSLNDKFIIPLTGVNGAIPGDSTVYVKVTTADTTAGAGTLAAAYIVGEMFVSGV